MAGARWNPVGTPVIYMGTSFAISALEILVHANVGRVPAGFHHVSASTPADAEVETFDRSQLSTWNGPDTSATQAFGAVWVRQRRTLVLFVHSVVTNGLDLNAIVNPAHPAFGQIVVSDEQPVYWDDRLMGSRS